MYYFTTWKQGLRKKSYTTKSLTNRHRQIHSDPKTTYACTMEIDPTINVLGPWTEIIAITNVDKPATNKSFDKRFDKVK